jgi:hypothetical protein
MTNLGELLINIVNYDKPKALLGLSQNGNGDWSEPREIVFSSSDRVSRIVCCEARAPTVKMR